MDSSRVKTGIFMLAAWPTQDDGMVKLSGLGVW
jgi:hypothetical protein